MTRPTNNENSLYEHSREEIVDLYGDRNNDPMDYGQRNISIQVPLVEVVGVTTEIAQPSLFDQPPEEDMSVEEEFPPRNKSTIAEKNARERAHWLKARQDRWGR